MAQSLSKVWYPMLAVELEVEYRRPSLDEKRFTLILSMINDLHHLYHYSQSVGCKLWPAWGIWVVEGDVCSPTSPALQRLLHCPYHILPAR